MNKAFSLVNPIHHLRVEGGLFFLLSILLFWQTGGSWWLFLLLLFVPDLAMLGYTANSQTGAVIYNLFHNYLFAMVLAVSGWLLSISLLLWVGLIWFAHIALDRAFGYGLKLPTAFQDTHLGRIGKNRA
jgi:hypothetical protein